MKRICSNCLTMMCGSDVVYTDSPPCSCEAEKYEYCEDELEDYRQELDEMQEVFDDLSPRDQAAVAYFMKGGV